MYFRVYHKSNLIFVGISYSTLINFTLKQAFDVVTNVGGLLIQIVMHRLENPDGRV